MKFSLLFMGTSLQQNFKMYHQPECSFPVSKSKLSLKTISLLSAWTGGRIITLNSSLKSSGHMQHSRVSQDELRLLVITIKMRRAAMWSNRELQQMACIPLENVLLLCFFLEAAPAPGEKCWRIPGASEKPENQVTGRWWSSQNVSDWWRAREGERLEETGR